MVRTDTKLSFGHFKGKTLDWLCKNAFQQLLWYAGRHLERDKYRSHTILGRCLKKIGTRKNYESCECADKSTHSAKCLGYFAGETPEDTERIVRERVEELTLPGFGETQMWLRVSNAHPKIVKAAAKMIDEKQLCWSCGTKLHYTGSPTDWETLSLHKACAAKHKKPRK